MIKIVKIILETKIKNSIKYKKSKFKLIQTSTWKQRLSISLIKICIQHQKLNPLLHKTKLTFDEASEIHILNLSIHYPALASKLTFQIFFLFFSSTYLPFQVLSLFQSVLLSTSLF